VPLVGTKPELRCYGFFLARYAVWIRAGEDAPDDHRRLGIEFFNDFSFYDDVNRRLWGNQCYPVRLFAGKFYILDLEDVLLTAFL